MKSIIAENLKAAETDGLHLFQITDEMADDDLQFDASSAVLHLYLTTALAAEPFKCSANW